MYNINYKPTLSSVALEYDEIQALLHKMIDSDFYIYMENSLRPFVCSAQHEKGSILKDVCVNVPYWDDEHRFIIVRDSDTNSSGYYGIENIIEEGKDGFNPRNID